jgi:hypothetical protein
LPFWPDRKSSAPCERIFHPLTEFGDCLNDSARSCSLINQSQGIILTVHKQRIWKLMLAGTLFNFAVNGFPGHLSSLFCAIVWSSPLPSPHLTAFYFVFCFFFPLGSVSKKLAICTFISKMTFLSWNHVLLFVIKGRKLVGPIKAITVAIHCRIVNSNLWINRQAEKMDREG